MKVEVWYCKDNDEFNSLMVNLEKERPDLKWVDGDTLSYRRSEEGDIWVVIDSRGLSMNAIGERYIPACLNQEDNTKYILANSNFGAKSESDIHYHTTK